MSDADVPCEGDAFGCAFDMDGADAGAAVDVFDLNEFCFRAAVVAVEAYARLLVLCSESGCVHFVVERFCKHFVGFRIRVDEMFGLPFGGLQAGEDGASDFEVVAFTKRGRRLLFDLCDAHSECYFGVAERAVNNRFEHARVVEADEPRRAARELKFSFVRPAALQPTQRVEADRVMERVVAADPFVERANQPVLIGEGHGFAVR